MYFGIGSGYNSVSLVAHDAGGVVFVFGMFGGGTETAGLLAFNMCGSEVPAPVALGEVDPFFPKFGDDGFGEEPGAGRGDVFGD